VKSIVAAAGDRAPAANSDRTRSNPKRRNPMPLIDVKLVEGAFNDEQKRELLPKITDAVESVYPGLRDVTFVTVHEVPQGEWGIGGEPMTADKVAAHARENLGS
jgi:4-oxalocrotonate tautomerase